jgi:hypothetical protein
MENRNKTKINQHRGLGLGVEEATGAMLGVVEAR